MGCKQLVHYLWVFNYFGCNTIFNPLFVYIAHTKAHMKKYFLLVLFCGIILRLTYAQTLNVTLEWNSPITYTLSEESTRCVMTFNDAASHFDYGLLPVWYGRVPAVSVLPGHSANVEIAKMIFETVPPMEMDASGTELIPDEVVVMVKQSSSSSALEVYVVPFRKNPFTDTFERLVSFSLSVISGDPLPADKSVPADFVAESKLAEGNWYTFYTEVEGMHQLSVADLEAMGVPVASLKPSTLKIFGNGGGMVPVSIQDARYDDLNEIAIIVTGAADGIFDGSDKIIFYGHSPHRWTYNVARDAFQMVQNIYSDRTGYFLTYGGIDGKRINKMAQSPSSATHTVNTVNYYLNHELEEVNLIGSGRRWYGEIFDVQRNYTYSFHLPDLDNNAPVNVYAAFAARSTSSSSFSVLLNGESYSVPIQYISLEYAGAYARRGTLNKSFVSSDPTLQVSITYNKPNNSALGWLDYFTVNARRNLVFTGGQMLFCDTESVGQGNRSNFVLSNVTSSVNVYDVTDHQQVQMVEVTRQGNQLSFVTETDQLRLFLAVDGDYRTPITGKKISNQNLHSHSAVNLVIVTPHEFLDQANQLAAFHKAEGLSARVVNVFDIYNEFSGGVQDISAIRDYLRMLYVRDTSENRLKYLLLFGDGSYDYKNKIPNNSNFIPTWQSDNSEDGTDSYTTDDFYGFLDPDEGLVRGDKLNLGIGRLTVTTVEEAEMALDKIFHYASMNPEVMGDWRNSITLVADDEDGGLHVFDAERLSRLLDTSSLAYNVDKIYSDAYPQVVASGGARYPDVTEAINTKMAKGTLIMNYVGHGGEVGWALERILELSDINFWTNYNQLSLFITATCEFARFDDPKRVSAGEQVFLNQKGGGVALMTTTRATFAGSNATLNKSIYTHAFTRINGEYPRMGDLMRKAKEASGSGMNAQKFILIGDPALRLAYPELKVSTTHFNETPVGAENDTIRALDFITISGVVTDYYGNPLPDFQGIVYPTVFDKPSEITTLGNDPNSPTIAFDLQNRILFKGQAEVINGAFSFSFLVPKDINYSYGRGKVSYYVTSAFLDGSGYDDHFIIGGYSNNAQDDEQGPEIRLYMNDPFFIDGGLTHANPVVYAEIFDASGINIGTGIGHDLTAILDGNSDKVYVLNDFYQGGLNRYQSGTVSYPLFNLEAGRHTLELKVWDALNNSATASVSFTVAGKEDVILDNFYACPNPFSGETRLFFEHNQSGENLRMQYHFFDLSGRLVRYMDVNQGVSAFRTSAVTWDGTNDAGTFLPGGLYICKLIVTNESMHSAVITSKFILNR
ncbi:MAG: type IX secretion system sortase PorU [Bacteroidia bacterium]|nr:type IX secretion system sortase PorU [Bacteroidia bacterium]